MAPDPAPLVPDRLGAGASIGLLLFIVTFLASQILVLPALLLLFIPLGLARDFYRIFTATYGAMWIAFAAGLIEHIGGTRIRVYGDPLVYGERAILISNHRTRIDWMFMWCFAARYGFLRSFRIVLKWSLKPMPFFGWAMQSLLFIFLGRGRQNRSADLARIHRICTYLSRERRVQSTLILFPEGTDLSQSNLVRDRKFAEDNDLSVYSQVLHPRSGAFLTAASALHGHIDALYDVTMAYVDYSPGERPSEASVLKGRLPKEVHLYVKRHDVQSLPEDSAGLEALLQRSFETKDKVLTSFYQDGAFPAHLTAPPPLASPSSAPHTPLPTSSSFDYEKQALAAFRLSCLGWTLVLALTISLARRYPVPFVLYIVLGTLFMAVTTALGGIDSLELCLPVWGSGRGSKRLNGEDHRKSA